MSFFALKTIALLSMLWDHVTYVLPLELPAAADYIGRIAAPIFLFSIVNGYRHTRDFGRYALRLLGFACLAEYPYSLLFGFRGNIMFTLLLGLLTLRLMDRGNETRAGLGYALAAGAVLLAQCLNLTEGGGRYLLFILVFYWTEAWPIRKKALLWLFLMPLSRYRLTWMMLSEQLFTARWLHMWAVNAAGPLLGVAFTFLYNGEKGRSFPGDKYLWYVFYPAHLLVLGLVKTILLGG